MANPDLPGPIGVDFTNASLTENTQAVALNRTTGERQYKKCAADGTVIFDGNEFVSGYTVGDVIVVSVNGPVFASQEFTLTAKPQNKTKAATAESSTLPAVSM